MHLERARSPAGSWDDEIAAAQAELVEMKQRLDELQDDPR